ncbi:hypothetical protein [Mesorhizobium sp. CO1-1-8]|uniref:hypothetical protein n=1 Tax=Mesorhizobium sp. CO1-1-8 TaxID=2876631 RepID=UPI001CD1222C|nr:hypothetical protein [Mesorhizobium sp. CO1-1-8]MBZ9775193.1 hypothetical protein [Mesorhizobium sp. CO1-1-8]
MRLKSIKPMEPELVDNPPEDDDWIHEIEFDGYRTQLIKDEDGIRLLTRRRYDWTARYQVFADQAAAIETFHHRRRGHCGRRVRSPGFPCAAVGCQQQ